MITSSLNVRFGFWEAFGDLLSISSFPRRNIVAGCDRAGTNPIGVRKSLVIFKQGARLLWFSLVFDLVRLTAKRSIPFTICYKVP